MTQIDFNKIIPFFDKLTDRQIDMIVQTAQEKTFETGKMITTGGGSCQGFIIVKSGLICASMVSEDGREAELFELSDGELCILSVQCIFLPADFHVQMMAERDSDVIIIPSATVEKLREQNIHVELFAYKTMTARFANVMGAVEELLFVPVEKRLAKLILRLGKMASAGGTSPSKAQVSPADVGDAAANVSDTSHTTISITQDALAKKLGTAREVVSRSLSSLKERGILEVRRGEIRIIKPSLLKELSQK